MRVALAASMALCVPGFLVAQESGIRESDRDASLECTKQENVDVSGWVDGEVINHGRRIPINRIRAIHADLKQAVPDGKTEILDAVFSGNTVATRIVFRGTHTAISRLPVMSELLVNLPPTGKRIQFEAIHWFKLRENKIIEHYAVRQDLSIARQLGLYPPPAPTTTQPR